VCVTFVLVEGSRIKGVYIHIRMCVSMYVRVCICVCVHVCHIPRFFDVERAGGQSDTMQQHLNLLQRIDSAGNCVFVNVYMCEF